MEWFSPAHTSLKGLRGELRRLLFSLALVSTPVAPGITTPLVASSPESRGAPLKSSQGDENIVASSLTTVQLESSDRLTY